MVRRGGDDPQPPLVDVSIGPPSAGDVPVAGEPLPANVPGGHARPADRLSVAARLGIVLAAAALFALGVVMGRGTITARFGTALPVTEPPGTTTAPASGTPPTNMRATDSTAPGTPPTNMRATDSTAPTTPATSPAPTQTFETSAGRGGLDEPAWPTTPGRCGSDTPKPIIDGAISLPGEIDATFVTGGSVSRVDLAAGTVGTPLLALNDSEYLVGLAMDEDSVVATAAPCDGRGDWRVMRVANNGRTTVIPVPDEQIRAHPVGGGDRVWVAMPPPGAYGNMSIPLMAADDPADTVTLPQGLLPMAGRGSTVVGQFLADGPALGDDVPGGLFGVVDTETGELLTRFGDWDAAARGDMINAVVDGDYLLAAPWVCEETCTLRRYDLATGEEHIAELDPPADRILAGGGVAIRPDGSSAALTLMAQPPAPQPFDPDPTPSTGPTGTVRIGLIDLETGAVRALPGLTLGPLQLAGLAFTPDGAWLVVAISEGDATRLLLYGADGDGPYDPGISVPGPTLWPLLAHP